MVAAYWTFPEQLAGRPVYHWCDNTGALAAATEGGAARFPGADLLTCMLHLILLGLQCQVYFDWVPSKANIADWPTRSDTIDLIPEWAVWKELRLPARHFLRLLYLFIEVPIERDFSRDFGAASRQTTRTSNHCLTGVRQ